MTAATASPSLRILQVWMSDAIASPLELEEAIEQSDHAAEMGVCETSELERIVTAGPRLSAIERFGIYHEGYRHRLIECLLDDYPALCHALGRDRFEEICLQYLQAWPSTARSLNPLGSHMAEFCQERLEDWSAFAAALARLEWSVVEVIHARSDPVLDARRLEYVPPNAWANARPVPISALRILNLTHPAHQYYDGFLAQQEPEIPSPARTIVLTYRNSTGVESLELSSVAERVLRRLIAGSTLGEALAGLDDDDTSRQEVMVAFQSWVAKGLFTRLDL